MSDARHHCAEDDWRDHHPDEFHKAVTERALTQSFLPKSGKSHPRIAPSKMASRT
jgi:hypothetical protein